MEIWYYDNGRLKQEKIVAEKWMRLIYENPVGQVTLPFLVKRKMLSHLYGMYCRTGFSARKIPQFIEQYSVDMTGCTGSYKNFAEFFSREKTGTSFPEAPEILGSPCEGLASTDIDIIPEKLVAAKDSFFPLQELFDDKKLAHEYSGGTILRIRLTPANYHRMHFFDDGKVTGLKLLDGDLFSVSPLAVSHITRLYCRNKRALILFSSQNFGDVVIVEVGATFVGSIVHCFKDGDYVQRGQQASYFLPGGSLVLIFFKRGCFVPNDMLLSQTHEGFETKVLLGDALGRFG